MRSKFVGLKHMVNNDGLPTELMQRMHIVAVGLASSRYTVGAADVAGKIVRSFWHSTIKKAEVTSIDGTLGKASK